MSKRLETLRSQLDEIENERNAAKTELTELISRDGDPTEAEAARTKELVAKHEELAPKADELRSEIARLETVLNAPERSVERPSPTVFVTEKRTGLEFGAEYGTPSQVRDSAVRAIEGGAVVELDDSRREAALATLARIDRPDKLARHIIATGRSDYRSAWTKLAAATAAGMPGAVRLSDAEHDAVEHVRAASLTTTAGGFAVPFTLDPTLIAGGTHYESSWRQFCRTVTITTDDGNGVRSAGVTASWDGEAAQVSDDAPTLAQPSITTYKAQAFVPFSIEIGMDWAQMESDIRREFQLAKDDLEDAAFASVSAPSNSPTGFFYDVVTNHSGQITTSAGSNVFAVADVHAVHDAMQARFRGRSSWVAAQRTYGLIRQFDTGGGAALWEYLGGGRPATLLGRPVYESENVDSSYGSGENYILGIGDFSNYVIVDRAGLNVELVPHLFGTANNRPTGQRGLYAWWRVGAGVINGSAFRVLNIT